MSLDDLLEEQGNQIGKKLQLNNLGVCSFSIENKLLISIERSIDSVHFYIYASIDHIPKDKEAEIASAALEGNLFGKETGDAVLAYASDLESLILFEKMNEKTITYPEFQERLRNFIGRLKYWSKKVEGLVAAPAKEFSLERHVENLQDKETTQIFFA